MSDSNKILKKVPSKLYKPNEKSNLFRNRKTYDMKMGRFFILSLLIVGFLITGCSGRLTTENKDNNAQDALRVVHFPAINSVNNIDVEFTKYERNNAYLTANICFETPSSQEYWYIDEHSVSLIIDDQKITYSSASYDPSKNLKKGFVCASIDFPVGVSPNLGEVELVVGRLKTESDQDCEKAQKKLDNNNSGIKLYCVSGSNSFGFGVSEWPIKMSEDEALRLAEDAFSEIVDGPWKFIFKVN